MVGLFHLLLLPGTCYLAQIIIFQGSRQTSFPPCRFSSALTSQYRMTALLCGALLCQSVHVSLSMHLTGLRRACFTHISTHT